MSKSGGVGEEQVGQKCKVTVNGNLVDGIIRYVGKIKSKDGIWAGVEIKTPDGKNDGTAFGVQYFSCKPLHGIFTPLSNVVPVASDSEAKSTPKKPSAASTSSPSLKSAKGVTSSPSVKTTTKTTTTTKIASPAKAPAKDTKKEIKKEQTIEENEDNIIEINEVKEVKEEKKNILSEEEEKTKMERAAYQSIKAFELQIEQLQEECQELNAWKQDAQEKLKGYAKSQGELKAELEKIQKEKEELTKTFEKEKNKMSGQFEKEFEKAKKLWEKEKEDLIEKYEEAQLNLESITLDKEISDEQCNELQREIEQLRGQIDIFEAQNNNNNNHQNAALAVASENFDGNVIKDLQENNERLKLALMKLRDVSLEEKQNAAKRIKELEKENAAIGPLEEKVERLENALAKAENNVEELKEQLDAALEAEDMIEEMTEKNLDLEQKVEELQLSIEDLEALRDISEELEEERSQSEKKLRKELNLKDIQLLDLETTVDNLHKKLKENEGYIEMFRGKVNELKLQLLTFQTKDHETAVEHESLEGRASKLADENLQLKAKVDKYEAAVIREELAQIDSALSSNHLKNIFLFIPTDTLKKENETLLCYLTIQRLERKCNLLLKNIKNRYHIHDYLVASVSDRNLDERYFGYRITWQLATAGHYLQEMKLAFDNEKEVERWLSYASIQWELGAFEHSIDKLLSALQSNSLNETYSLLELEKSIKQMKKAGIKHSALPDRTSSFDQLRTIIYTSQFTLLELQRIHKLLSLNLVQYNHPNARSIVDQVCRIDDFKSKVKRVMDLCRKVVKNLQSDHLLLSNNPKLDQINSLSLSSSSFSSEYFSIIEKIGKELEGMISNVEKEPNTAEELILLLQSFIASAQNEQVEIVSVSSSSTPVDQPANQNEISEKGGEDQDPNRDRESSSDHHVDHHKYSHLFSFLDRKLDHIEESLISIQSMAEELASDDDVINTFHSLSSSPSALELHSSSIKGELNSLDVLKNRIAALEEISKGKDEEIGGYVQKLADAQRKHTLLHTRLHSYKSKCDLLSDQLASFELDSKRQLKTYEDALVSMQEDVELLEQEKRELTDKLSQSRKFGVASADAKLGGASGDDDDALSVPFEMVSKEIAALREALQFLRLENSRLKSKSLLSSPSSSLSSLSLPSSKQLSGENAKDLASYKKELNELQRQLFHLQSSSKVVDLSSLPSSLSSSSLSSSSLSSSSLPSPSNDFALLNAKSLRLQSKLHSLLSSHSSSLPAKSPAQFAPMVASNVVNLSNSDGHLLSGTLSVPLSSHLRDLLSPLSSPSLPLHLSLPQSQLKSFLVGL